MPSKERRLAKKHKDMIRRCLDHLITVIITALLTVTFTLMILDSCNPLQTSINKWGNTGEALIEPWRPSNDYWLDETLKNDNVSCPDREIIPLERKGRNQAFTVVCINWTSDEPPNSYIILVKPGRDNIEIQKPQ